MNPAANAAVSGGLSYALSTILVWLLSLMSVTVPPSVVDAFTVVFTALIGLAFHVKTQSKADPAPAPVAPAIPAAPAPAANP